LATGDCYPTNVTCFRASKASVVNFISEVCEAIYQAYQDEVFKCPNTHEECRAVADGFEQKWNFPHAIGALDGKHIRIKNPPKAGSMYYNYKGYYSIVLMALVDADYNFIWVHCGSDGSASDAQIFNHSPLRDAILDDSINFPPPEPLANTQGQPVPYFILADDAFALKEWLQKPYGGRSLTREQRIFNYRLSRARRVVENAFGILASRFRCLHTAMPQSPARVTTIVMACCTLHNLLRVRNHAVQPGYTDGDGPMGELLPGSWRADQQLDSGPPHKTTDTNRGKQVREYLTQYFNGEGALTWQNAKVDF
jgi:hypothetical protein